MDVPLSLKYLIGSTWEGGRCAYLNALAGPW